MNKRIRKKKMKQYAKQHNIKLGKGKIDIELPPIPDWHPSDYTLMYMGTVVPPKPTLHVDHV